MLQVIVGDRQSAVNGGYFLPLEAYKAPFGTMKASPWAFQVRSSLDPLSSMSAVHGVFSNKALSSNSRKQTRTVAIPILFWDILDLSCSQQLVRGFLKPISSLVFEFSFFFRQDLRAFNSFCNTNRPLVTDLCHRD